MQTVYKRASVIAGFAILALVLLINAWFTKRQIETQILNHALLVHTQDVLMELTQTLLLLDDAETGQRGYLYTGQQQYLDPYERASSEVEKHVEAVAQLTAGNPQEQEEVKRLRDLAQSKLGELRETISLYRSGKTKEAEARVLSGEGKATMDQIRSVAGEWEREETELETERTAAYERSIVLTRVSIYLATFVALLGALLLALYILRHIDVRDRHAAQLREREEWYRVTLTSIGDAVIATDSRGLVTFINPVAEKLTGCDASQAKGRPVSAVFPIFNEYTNEPVENPVEKVVAHGRIIGLTNHTVMKRRDGTLIPIEDSAAPIHDDRERLIGVVLVFRDATAERERQEIVRRAEKLAAASRLASTVAHEINNPLEAVGNLVYLAKLEDGVPPGVAAHLALAEDQLERVSHITKQTLAFYRESRKWETVDLVAIVESSLGLYSNKLKNKSIVIEKEFAESPVIQGSAGELKQLIANLISNAIDAVGTNGRLKVAVSPRSTADQDWVEFKIQDDGPGIAEDHLSKIFEPFFTTKQDVGTGLGLWVARQIAERHGGTIEAYSGQSSTFSGATFVVRLRTRVDADAKMPA